MSLADELLADLEEVGGEVEEEEGAQVPLKRLTQFLFYCATSRMKISWRRWRVWTIWVTLATSPSEP